MLPISCKSVQFRVFNLLDHMNECGGSGILSFFHVRSHPNEGIFGSFPGSSRYGIKHRPMHYLTSPKPKLDGGERSGRTAAGRIFGLFTHSPHPFLPPSVPGASKDEGPPQKEGEGRANFIHRTAGHSLGANFFYPFCWETETGLKVSEKQDLK